MNTILKYTYLQYFSIFSISVGKGKLLSPIKENLLLIASVSSFLLSEQSFASLDSVKP